MIAITIQYRVKPSMLVHGTTVGASPVTMSMTSEVSWSITTVFTGIWSAVRIDTRLSMSEAATKFSTLAR